MEARPAHGKMLFPWRTPCLRYNASLQKPLVRRRGGRDRRSFDQGNSMKLNISKMAAAVQPSATLAAAARAKQLRTEGVRLFDFSVGEPDFPTPEHICQAAFKAVRDGF